MICKLSSIYAIQINVLTFNLLAKISGENILKYLGGSLYEISKPLFRETIKNDQLGKGYAAAWS